MLLPQNLEADLDGDESQLLPDLLAKLLYALTYNRQIKCAHLHLHPHNSHLYGTVHPVLDRSPSLHWRANI